METNNKKLIISTIIFTLFFILINIGSGLISFKLDNNPALQMPFFSWRNGILLPFLIFVFGNFLSYKTKSYKKALIIAFFLIIIIFFYNFILSSEKTVNIFDLISYFFSPLFVLIVGFLIGIKNQKNNIGNIRKISFFILLFLIITIGILMRYRYSSLSYLINAPLLIISFIKKPFTTINPILRQLIWFIYYTLFLYFILLNRKWIYVGLATIIQLGFCLYLYQLLAK